ncbi:hypothetical protein PsYK624_017780 [Phanerochaete sordida]|uniref:DUF6532 domain-containing protein n=1 Tax=Phanerochaete sordida TaxID=48140 RepID=A0A9P3G0Y2_9APHY|nr:hypothetical protein PsYK624_017780 [Phanerochaete sordida]
MQLASGPAGRPPNRTPSPADSEDMNEDSIDEEARRQELARVTWQKLAQAAAKKRLAAINAKYGVDSDKDDDDDKNASTRLNASRGLRPVREVSRDNGELPQQPAVQPTARQPEREHEDVAIAKDWEALEIECDGDGDDEVEHTQTKHAASSDYQYWSSAPCGHAISELSAESKHERNHNDNSPEDNDRNSNGGAQQDKLSSHKSEGKGKQHVRGPPSGNNRDEDSSTQYDQPRRRKNKNKGKGKSKSKGKGKGKKRVSNPSLDRDKEQENDSTSHYEHSTRESSDEDSAADAVITNDDNDLAAASVNPQKLKRMLASQEVKLTVFDWDANESDVKNSNDQPPLLPVKQKIGGLGPSRVGPSRAGPAHAGPSADASPLFEDEDEDKEPIDPTAAVSLFALIYGHKGKVRTGCLNPRLRAVIKLASIIREEQLYTVNGFPDSLKYNKLRLLLKCLKKATVNAKDDEIYQHLGNDTDWSRKIISMLKTRLSQIQGYVRAIAVTKVLVHYKLNNNLPDLERRLAELLKGLQYIFSGDILAFLHPCIADILSLLLFKQRATFLELRPNFFNVECEGKVYKMMPGPLICLMATVIHSAIRNMASPS